MQSSEEGRWVTTTKAAQVMGVSADTVRRMRRAGDLASDVRGGVHYFDVAKLPRRKRRVKVDHAHAAKLRSEADAFRALGRGVPIVKVVLELGLSPREGEKILAAWVRLQSIIFLDSNHLRQIESIPGIRGVFPLADADALVETVKRSVSPTECATCRNAAARVCVACAESLGL